MYAIRSYYVWTGTPERGDVDVFKWPRDNSTDFIKRLIGLPGDRIQVVGGILHINGKPVERRRIEDFVYVDQDGSTRRIPQFVETLPGGREHRILEESDTAPFDNTRITSYNVCYTKLLRSVW